MPTTLLTLKTTEELRKGNFLKKQNCSVCLGLVPENISSYKQFVMGCCTPSSYRYLHPIITYSLPMKRPVLSLDTRLKSSLWYPLPYWPTYTCTLICRHSKALELTAMSHEKVKVHSRRYSFKNCLFDFTAAFVPYFLLCFLSQPVPASSSSACEMWEASM